MSLLIRIDVDRPYGRRPLLRHIASRISSDYYLPKIDSLGYLTELVAILGMLNQRRVSSYIFFRRCTFPSNEVRMAIEAGGHKVGLHLEDSRSFSTFLAEKVKLEQHIGQPIFSLSKHGSGQKKYGLRHHAPYEPEKYVSWAEQTGIQLILGNLEDPTVEPVVRSGPVVFYPAAFWLEPPWRNMEVFNIDWLIDRAKHKDVVVLLHPENIIHDAELLSEFLHLVESCEVKAEI